jgi:hypothetical protein
MTPANFDLPRTCQFRKSNGELCRRAVTAGEGMCWQHARSWRHKWRSLTRNQSILFILAVAAVVIGVVSIVPIDRLWRPVHRHMLSEKERALFEKPLSDQKEPREEIQIVCAEKDEPACVYATQFVNIFREAGWKVQNNQVERVRMMNPAAGVILFKHGEGKLDPDNWRSGLWTSLTASLVDVRQAFVNIGIEPENAGNPELPEGVISVYFGLEKEDESKPTSLTKTMERLGKNWRGGPVPK